MPGIKDYLTSSMMEFFHLRVILLLYILIYSSKNLDECSNGTDTEDTVNGNWLNRKSDFFPNNNKFVYKSKL